MRHSARVLIAALSACALAACSASAEDQQNSKQDAADRGFIATAVDSAVGRAWPEVSVSFGDKGCTGTITYSDDKVTLVVKLHVPGTVNETQDVHVDDPRVSHLRTTPPFSDQCFTKQR